MQFVSAGYLAPLLGVTKETVIALGDKGILPMLRLGPKTIRFPLAEVQARLKAGNVQGQTVTPPASTLTAA